ncbi:MAG: DNA gyrase C-terminal beta-propeller domain-containing protein, partial [Thermoplasmata archaeon]
VLPVRESDELLVTTQGGVTIRLPVSSVRAQGRNTMGVRIIRIEEGDPVKDAVALEPPPEGTEEPTGAAPDPEEDDEAPTAPR